MGNIRNLKRGLQAGQVYLANEVQKQRIKLAQELIEKRVKENVELAKEVVDKLGDVVPPNILTAARESIANVEKKQ